MKKSERYRKIPHFFCSGKVEENPSKLYNFTFSILGIKK